MFLFSESIIKTPVAVGGLWCEPGERRKECQRVRLFEDEDRVSSTVRMLRGQIYRERPNLEDEEVRMNT